MKIWMPGRLALSTARSAVIDVLLAGARQAQHDRLGHGLRDRGGPIRNRRRRRRKARLDDIDIEPLELARDRDLLLDVHGAAGRLFAVAQRGVEDPDVVRSVDLD